MECLVQVSKQSQPFTNDIEEPPIKVTQAPLSSIQHEAMASGVTLKGASCVRLGTRT